MPPTTQINIRRDTAANFTSADPTLALGEIAYETDTFRFKVGTGSTAWNSLGYAAQNPTSLTVTNTTASTSTTTGALTVAGGVGIGGALNTGGNAVVNSIKVGTGTAAAPNTNTVVGASAGNIMQAGADFNACFGVNAGYGLTTGDFNTFIGGQAGVSASNTSQNTAVGYAALQSGTGSGNTAVGSLALFATTGASFCTAVGGAALANNRASDLVAVGHEALDANTLGTANVALGRFALGAATTAIGTFTTTPVAAGSGYTANQTEVTVTLIKKSGADTFTGTVQAALTTNASGAVTAVRAAPVSAGSIFTGSNVIFEPSGFGGSGCEISIATLASASSNTAVGHQAGLSLTTAGSCTLVGANAGDVITSATSTTAVGHNALGALTTGSLNTGVGASALLNVVTGAQNTALGWSAGQSVTSSDAVCIGTRALLNATTATQSVAVGSAAGRYRGSGTDSLTSATNSIFIGYQSRANGDSQTNQVVIAGVDGLGDGSNTTVIGNLSTTSTRIPAGNLTLSNGNLILGTAGNGIDFSADANAAGMTSELLDDYEEGTFTPTIPFGGNSVSQAWTTKTGSYTKVGRAVFVKILIEFSNKGTSTGNAVVGNLPFTPANDGITTPSAVLLSETTFADVPYARVRNNVAAIDLYEVTNAGVLTTLTDADFTNTSIVALSLVYNTA